MSISTPDLLIAVGVYGGSIVLTLLWAHLSSQQSIARTAKSYLGIALRMLLVHTVVMLFCGYTRLPIRRLALPINALVMVMPYVLFHIAKYFMADALSAAFGAILFVPAYAIRQFILGFPDRDIIAPEPEVTIPDRQQREAISSPRPSNLSGEVATVVATLKPSGTIRIGDEQYSATSDGSLFIDAGEKVKVCGERNGTLVVRRISAP